MNETLWDAPVTLGLSENNRGALQRALEGVVGPDHVLTDVDATRAEFLQDYTGKWGGPAWVIQPADTDEVSEVLRLLHSYSVPFVVQSGNTGLVGGSVPRPKVEVVLNLRRLRTVWPAGADPAKALDFRNNQITVGAGTTLGELHAIAARLGLRCPIQISAQNACVGGMIATNAGGTFVIADGMMDRHVIGIEGCLADGTIVQENLAGLDKHNTGPSITRAVLGSEGTFLVVTRARFQLQPKLANRWVFMLAVPTMDAAVITAEVLRQAFQPTKRLKALEVMDAACVELVRKLDQLEDPFKGQTPPPPGSQYLLVEVAGEPDPCGELMALVTGPLEVKAGISNSAVATEPGKETLFWKYREVSEAIRRRSLLTRVSTLKLDVSVPLANYAELVQRSADILALWPFATEIYNFGHIADGTLHFNVLIDLGLHDEFTQQFLDLVVELGGAVSSEHGIGVHEAKLRRIEPTRRRLWAATRQAWGGVRMNPGVGP